MDRLATMDRFFEGQIRAAQDTEPYTPDRDPQHFSWNTGDERLVRSGRRLDAGKSAKVTSLYRPFFPQKLAFSTRLLERTYRLPEIFPLGSSNSGIAIVSPGSKSPFGVLATDRVPSVHLINSDRTLFFARWMYPDKPESLFDNDDTAHTPISNIRAGTVDLVATYVGRDLDDQNLFDYTYGILNCPDFRREFEVNLKKEAPRVPLLKDEDAFCDFVDAGSKLFALQTNFDDVSEFSLVEEWTDDVGPDHPDFNADHLLVGSKKMKYPKVTDTDPDSETYGKKIADKTRLIYNDYLTLSGIPIEAHDYVLGTRSGIDWIIDRWYVKTDKESGIVNDVNQWGLEQGNPRYIIDLIKRVVTVSLRTVEIVESLPKLRFDENGTHVVPSGTDKA